MSGEGAGVPGEGMAGGGGVGVPGEGVAGEGAGREERPADVSAVGPGGAPSPAEGGPDEPHAADEYVSDDYSGWEQPEGEAVADMGTGPWEVLGKGPGGSEPGPPTAAWAPPPAAAGWDELAATGWEAPAPTGWEPPAATAWEESDATGWEPPAATGWEESDATRWEPPAATGWEVPPAPGWEPPPAAGWEETGTGESAAPGTAGWEEAEGGDPAARGPAGWEEAGTGDWTAPGTPVWEDEGTGDWTAPGTGGWDEPGDTGDTDAPADDRGAHDPAAAGSSSAGYRALVEAAGYDPDTYDPYHLGTLDPTVASPAATGAPAPDDPVSGARVSGQSDAGGTDAGNDPAGDGTAGEQLTAEQQALRQQPAEDQAGPGPGHGQPPEPLEDDERAGPAPSPEPTRAAGDVGAPLAAAGPPASDALGRAEVFHDPERWHERAEGEAGRDRGIPSPEEVESYARDSMADQTDEAAHDAERAAPGAGVTLSGSHQLQDWGEPPSGELPAALGDPTGAEPEGEAWEALGPQARWHRVDDSWDDASDVDSLAGAGATAGALPADHGDHQDPYLFDEDLHRPEEEPSGAHPAVDAAQPAGAEAAGASARSATAAPPGEGDAGPGTRTAPAEGGQPAARSTADLASRVAFGVGLVILLAIAYLLGPVALLVLAAGSLVVAAAETYGILQRSGFRPATLLGLVATAGMVAAGYWRGLGALPLILGLTFAATMVWYLLGIVEARPLANVAVTSMAVLWIGFFGSFAGLLLRAHHGRGLFLGVVVVTVVSDIVAYLVGRGFGRRPLVPGISPGKTVEGLVAGTVAALVLGVVMGRELAAWVGITDGLALGVTVAVLAPIGDLFESLIKRDLNVKDSGTILGGHGGVLDRLDSLLLVLPGAYFLATYLHLIK